MLLSLSLPYNILFLIKLRLIFVFQISKYVIMKIMNKTVTIIMPVFNEVNYIYKIVRRVNKCIKFKNKL